MDSTEECMLTTVDNPWNPFTHWDEWWAFDYNKGYNTPGLLARICDFSMELSDADQTKAINDAINEIVKINASGMHRKITRSGVAIS